jgi:hypothetical protein
MQTKSYISAAALAAALFAIPQHTLAQGLGLDLGGIGVQANVDVGGDSIVDVDAGVDVGGDDGLDVDADVILGSSGMGESAGSTASLIDVDVDLGSTAGTGPNGGTLIDLGRSNSGGATLDAGIDLLDGTTGNSQLINGDVRIGSLGDDDARADALLALIHSPNLAGIDLDEAIDDRLVSIIAAADLFGPERLADITAAVEIGGDGRAELLAALSASVELGSILDKQGIAVEDVLAVQVGDNGATEIIILGDVARVALLADNGNLADLTVDQLANVDIDLLSREELAEIDTDLLPADVPATASLRLLGSDGDLADPSGELAEADLTLLQEGTPTAKASLQVLGGDDGDSFADLSVAELAGSRIALVTADDSEDGDGGTNAGPATGNGDIGGGVADGTAGDTDGAGEQTDSDEVDAAAVGDDTAPPLGVLPTIQVDAGFAIATLGCGTGILALATGVDATPQAISQAQSLELVRIDGCERTLVDVEASGIRSAIATNPEISAVLDDASIPLDQVIGATIQGGTLTLFIEPTLS